VVEAAHVRLANAVQSHRYHCVYADDLMAICLIHETGTAPGGGRFDNLAVYTLRLRPDGQADRVWTIDLDADHCESFWQKNPGTPSKDFS
jgi:hypothetical protein